MCIFPMLKEQLQNPDMLEFVLPSLMVLVEHSTPENYKNLLQPVFKHIFSMNQPVQVAYIRIGKSRFSLVGGVNHSVY